MGPNGSGKSTLAYALMGNTNYTIHNSQFTIKSNKTAINLDGADLLPLSPDERAKRGLFLAFQNPLTIEGVTSVVHVGQSVITPPLTSK